MKDAVVDVAVDSRVLVQSQGRGHKGSDGRALSQDCPVGLLCEGGRVVVDVVDVDDEEGRAGPEPTTFFTFDTRISPFISHVCVNVAIIAGPITCQGSPKS